MLLSKLQTATVNGGSCKPYSAYLKIIHLLSHFGKVDLYLGMLFFALHTDILSLTLHCTDFLLNGLGTWQQDCFQNGLHLHIISQRELRAKVTATYAASASIRSGRDDGTCIAASLVPACRLLPLYSADHAVFHSATLEHPLMVPPPCQKAPQPERSHTAVLSVDTACHLRVRPVV